MGIYLLVAAAPITLGLISIGLAIDSLAQAVAARNVIERERLARSPIEDLTAESLAAARAVKSSFI